MRQLSFHKEKYLIAFSNSFAKDVSPKPFLKKKGLPFKKKGTLITNCAA
jgi:hypothetical protein